MGKIGVIIKEPGRVPRHVNISDTLENLQKTVGGYIETVTLCSDLVVICDEEGRIKGKPHCCNIGGVDFCGTIILAGVDGDEFADIPCGYDDFKWLFPQLWEEP
jgi:hypothetical protein